MNTRLAQSICRVLLALVICLTLAGVSAQEARAATYTVTNLLDDGSNGSLRKAITDANTSAGVADTITFTVSGTVTLISALPVISDDLTIDGSGQTVTISGSNTIRGLQIGAGINATLRHLTIANGKASHDAGGGVKNEGTLAVEDCTFSDNWGLDGGAIYSAGTLDVIDSTFLNNTANGFGGAIDAFNSTLTVSGSTFSGNHAESDGGGIDGYQSSGTATVTVTNSTFSRNTAGNDGGGIAIYHATLTLVNSTLSGNGASSSGGGLMDYVGTVHLKNTILANSTSGGDCFSSLGLASSLNNLFESGYQCGTSVSSADPLLGPLANNGGTTRTFALLTGSPAIDAGDDATCTAAPVNNLDQRGVIRPYGTHCDIGSFEKNTTTLILRSAGARDGWVLESSENSTVGGSLNSTAVTFRLGDDAARKQYRGILSFATGTTLPDNAIITQVTLMIKKQGIVGGGNPVTTFQGFMVDIKKGTFGTAALQIGDFQAAASRSYGPFKPSLVSNWYSIDLTKGKAYINKLSTLSGLTQIRLRFKLDDNNNTIANYLSLYSGNCATVAARPKLLIEYYVP